MTNKVCIVCVTGTLEKLQMAAMIASVSVANEKEVSIFLSMNAMKFFVKSNTELPPVEGDVGELLKKKGVPPFKQLFGHSVDLGDASILPCSMAMDIMNLSSEDLDEELGPPTGLTKFLSDAEGAQIYTF